VPRLGCINLHGSLLPKYRGAAPIQWSVLNGDGMTGVTTMYMSEGLDEGDMIEQDVVEIGPNETSGELFDRLAPLGAKLLSHTLQIVAKGNAPRVPQPSKGASYAPMLDKSLCPVDFTRTAQEVHNQIRGLCPWPCATAALGGKRVKLIESRLAEGSGQPGEVLSAGHALVIACGTGAVEITFLQVEGSRPMPAADYLRGHPLAPGTLFTTR